MCVCVVAQKTALGGLFKQMIIYFKTPKSIYNKHKAEKPNYRKEYLTISVNLDSPKLTTYKRTF